MTGRCGANVRVGTLTETPHAFNARLADWADDGEEQRRARLVLPGSYGVLALTDQRPVGVVRGVPHDDGTSALHSM